MVLRPPQTASRAGSVDLYLHALLLLTDHGQQADTGDVAARVGVSAAAASRMLKNLATKKLVHLAPYHGAELTAEGMHRALRIVRRHRLLEVFLHQVMGFDLRDSHARAVLLQPCIDEAFEDKLDAMLGRPTVDPHGQPIPAKNATWPRLADSPLLELPPGTSGRISRLTSEDSEAITYLESLGLRPGALILLESVAPFDGPVVVRAGRHQLHLGRRLAQFIRVGDASSSASASTTRGEARREKEPAPRRQQAANEQRQPPPQQRSMKQQVTKSQQQQSRPAGRKWPAPRSTPHTKPGETSARPAR